MNSWKNIKDYTKNDLFYYFKSHFTKRDFIEKGHDLYGLKAITCKLKLKRGLKEGIIIVKENKYITVKK